MIVLVLLGIGIIAGLIRVWPQRRDPMVALEIFRLSPDEFNLVITDYTMPELTGLDLAREVRRIRPDMPILLCTEFSEKITPDHVKKLGMGLLMKPYGMRQKSEVGPKDSRRSSLRYLM